MRLRVIVVALLYCSTLLFGSMQVHGQSVSASTIPYGDNKDAGNYAVLNGVKLYFETYGKGDPLLLIHGNGGSMKAMQYQIAYFARNYKVIVMDCRGRGKSEWNFSHICQQPIFRK